VLTWSRSVLWQHVLCTTGQNMLPWHRPWPCQHDRIILVIFSQALHMAPWWWIVCDSKHVGALKYFIILIVSIYYILCISWIIKCLIVIDARCKHEDRYSSALSLTSAPQGCVCVVPSRFAELLFWTYLIILYTRLKSTTGFWHLISEGPQREHHFATRFPGFVLTSFWR